MTQVRSLIIVIVTAAVLIIIPLAASGHWKSENVEDISYECKYGRGNYVLQSQHIDMWTSTGDSSTYSNPSSFSEGCSLKGVVYAYVHPDTAVQSYTCAMNQEQQMSCSELSTCSTSSCDKFASIDTSTDNRGLGACRSACDCDEYCVAYQVNKKNTRTYTCEIFSVDHWTSSCEAQTLLLDYSTADTSHHVEAHTVGPVPETPPDDSPIEGI
tara:strand:+ start:174 stop:812 length:639 start_codon:yes stop_codon:yes gene_type:complete